MGDVLELSNKCIHLDPQHGLVRVTIMKGKAVTARGGAYTVHAHMDKEHFKEVSRFLQPLLANTNEVPIFPMDRSKDPNSISRTNRVFLLNRALHDIDKKLSTRSIRRGSLQVMAMDPEVSNDTLRLFSGHTNDKMLLRYLDYGRPSGTNQEASRKAALNLVRLGATSTA